MVSYPGAAAYSIFVGRSAFTARVDAMSACGDSVASYDKERGKARKTPDKKARIAGAFSGVVS